MGQGITFLLIRTNFGDTLENIATDLKTEQLKNSCRFPLTGTVYSKSIWRTMKYTPCSMLYQCDVCGIIFH
jgi:hypothetical protein